MFILDFHVFFLIFDPKIWKSKVFENPSKPLPLGPCPDDRAQNSVQDSLNESSGDPNPTLVIIKILFKFCQFWSKGAFAPRGPFRALDSSTILVQETCLVTLHFIIIAPGCGGSADSFFPRGGCPPCRRVASQNDPKMVPKWSQNGRKIIPKYVQNYPKIIPKLSQNNAKLIPKSSQNDPKVIPKLS